MKSIDYIKKTAKDPKRSSFADRDFSLVSVLSSETYFDRYLNGIHDLLVKGKDHEGKQIELNISLTFADDYDFQYFVSESFLSDGTLLYLENALNRIAEKICAGKTFFTQSKAPENGDSIHYTIGDYVIITEYDDDGTVFATKEKPWLSERTTIMLPISYKKMQDKVKSC